MSISLLVLLLFSNAVTIRRDKSILFSRLVAIIKLVSLWYYYIYWGILIALTLLCLGLVIYIIILIVKRIKVTSRKMIVFIGSGYYLLGLFTFTSDYLNSHSTSGYFYLAVVSLSILTLYYVRVPQSTCGLRETTIKYIDGIIMFISTMPWSIIWISAVSISAVIWSRWELFLHYDFYYLHPFSLMFVIFSSSILIQILVRLISNILICVFFDCYSLQEATLLNLMLPYNYRIISVEITSLMLCIYTFIPGLWLLFEMYTFFNNYSNLALSVTPAQSIVHKYTSPCMDYDPVSYPEDRFIDHIWEKFNPKLSQTQENLLLKNPTIIYRDGAEGTVEDSYHIKNGRKTDEWVRIRHNICYKRSYVHSTFTRNIGAITSPKIDMYIQDYPYNLDVGNFYLKNSNVSDLYALVKSKPNRESYVDNYYKSILELFMPEENGYKVTCQDPAIDVEHPYRQILLTKPWTGRTDLQVNNNGIAVLIVEDKSQKGVSFLNAIGQASRYAKVSNHSTAMFCLCTKGSLMSFFLYEQDYTVQHPLGLKGKTFVDMLGIAVDRDGLYLLPVCNTYQPQMVIYDSGPDGSKSDQLACTAIFNYIKNFDMCEGTRDIKDTLLLPVGKGERVSVLAHLPSGRFLNMGPDGKFIRTS